MGGRCLRSLNNICRTSKECAGGQREVRGEGGREGGKEGEGKIHERIPFEERCHCCTSRLELCNGLTRHFADIKR